MPDIPDADYPLVAELQALVQAGAHRAEFAPTSLLLSLIASLDKDPYRPGTRKALLIRSLERISAEPLDEDLRGIALTGYDRQMAIRLLGLGEHNGRPASARRAEVTKIFYIESRGEKGSSQDDRSDARNRRWNSFKKGKHLERLLWAVLRALRALVELSSRESSVTRGEDLYEP